MNPDKNKACIILPTYNGARFINETLVSINNQSYDNIDVLMTIISMLIRTITGRNKK